jgi:hypothetical protein
MNHWDPVERLVKERHADFARESTRVTLARRARVREQPVSAGPAGFGMRVARVAASLIPWRRERRWPGPRPVGGGDVSGLRPAPARIPSSVAPSGAAVIPGAGIEEG